MFAHLPTLKIITIILPGIYCQLHVHYYTTQQYPSVFFASGHRILFSHKKSQVRSCYFIKLACCLQIVIRVMNKMKKKKKKVSQKDSFLPASRFLNET